MHTIDTFAFTTVRGAKVEATFETPGDGRMLTRVIISAAGKTTHGLISDVYEVPEPIPECDLFVPKIHFALWALGATHYVWIEGRNVDLALDATTAGLLDARMKAAQRTATDIRTVANAAKEAAIRASGTVRRVLRHSPAWQDAYGLEEAYPTDDPRDAPWTRYGIPGAKDVTVHPRCPSLHAVQSRSPAWGQFYGHSNTLSLVSDTDWDLLVAETTEQLGLDQERQAAHTAREAATAAMLRAVAIPDRAIAAFRRYKGDAEAAWEDAEEGDASLIRQYGDAIAEQGIAFATQEPPAMPIHPPGA